MTATTDYNIYFLCPLIPLDLEQALPISTITKLSKRFAVKPLQPSLWSEFLHWPDVLCKYNVSVVLLQFFSEPAPVLQLGLLTHHLCSRDLGWHLLSSTWQWKVSSSLSFSFYWRLANSCNNCLLLYQWPVTSDHNTILLQKKFYYRQIRALLVSTRSSTPGTHTIRQDQVNCQ